MPSRLLTLLLGLAILLSVPSLVATRALPPVSAIASAQETPAGATPGPAPATRCPAPEGFSDAGVTVGLEATFPPPDVVSFGLPLPAGVLSDAGTLRVTAGGQPVPATVAVLLDDLDAAGVRVGVRAVLVQFPSSILPEGCGSVELTWQGGGVTVTSEPASFAETSAASDEVVDQATYTIEERNGEAALVTSNRQSRVLFTAREPAVLATFPAGYLAATGIFGHQVAASQIGPDLAGLQFISDAVTPFGLSAMYQESYPINADKVIDPTDPDDGYEGWLYDRCTTFLSFYVHTGDTRFLREGYRLCSYYADHIELSGENRGIFTGKPDPDPKYSHLRGLYAYYALTGDEAAREAGTAIAERFLADQDFVAPYRNGQMDNFWTERILAVSLESLYYGHRLTGDGAYLTAVAELVGTAHRHITGDAATLTQLNPAAPAFPPQNCLIHTAGQAGEGDDDEPWCSGWMPVLMIDTLLTYQDQTDDTRVDEIFVRMTRYLRDIGAAYFDPATANADDTFLYPAAPSTAPDDENQRALVPLYGAALGVDGQRVQSGEYDDFQHCLDVTAITAAGIRALKRGGGFDQNPIGPFASEGDSFLALHEEFAFCAAWTFADQARPHRNPDTWTAEELAEGLADPATFIDENNIANISHAVSPARKISWWFNSALEQFALLLEAGVAVPELHPGVIQPGDVAPQPVPTSGPATVATAAPAPTTAAAPTPAPETATPTGPAASEGGAAADGPGQIVYTTVDGSIYRVAARAGATPEHISAVLDRMAPVVATAENVPRAVDRWGGVSANGQWLLLRTERFFADCAGWACLVVMPADLSSSEAVRIDGEMVHPNGPAAIAGGGDLVIYADAGGPHEYDLWATARLGNGWSAPFPLTGDSPYPFHAEPAISGDGKRVLFACGNHQYLVESTAICEVATDGTGFRVVLTPADGPAGSSPTAALRHPAYVPDGSIVFAADWTGPAVWRIPPGEVTPERIGPGFDVDYGPCVLPDGRIASLWQGRSENTASLRELKVMTPDGLSYIIIVTGQDIDDIDCGG
jgi:hypothetical protein